MGENFVSHNLVALSYLEAREAVSCVEILFLLLYLCCHFSSLPMFVEADDTIHKIKRCALE